MENRIYVEVCYKGGHISKHEFALFMLDCCLEFVENVRYIPTVERISMQYNGKSLDV